MMHDHPAAHLTIPLISILSISTIPNGTKPWTEFHHHAIHCPLSNRQIPASSPSLNAYSPMPALSKFQRHIPGDAANHCLLHSMLSRTPKLSIGDCALAGTRAILFCLFCLLPHAGCTQSLLSLLSESDHNHKEFA